MTEIFFSYSGADRDRVRPIRDGLVAQGFDVFWDQQVPSGKDWDTWIRERLAQSKCVVVFWSKQSITSDNVRHEATVAKQQAKLMPFLLETITAEQFPMGLYTHQAANLAEWKGDIDRPEWNKFLRELEGRLTPLWVKRQIAELEAEPVAERTRRQGAEHRDKVLQAQIVKEVQAQQDLKRERDTAADEVAALKAIVRELRHANSETGAKAELSRRLNDTEQQRMAMTEEVKRAEANAAELSQRLSEAEARPRSLAESLERRRLEGKQVKRAPFATAEVDAAKPSQSLGATAKPQNLERESETSGAQVSERDVRLRVDFLFAYIAVVLFVIGVSLVAVGGPTEQGPGGTSIVLGTVFALTAVLAYAYRRRQPQKRAGNPAPSMSNHKDLH